MEPEAQATLIELLVLFVQVTSTKTNLILCKAMSISSDVFTQFVTNIIFLQILKFIQRQMFKINWI